MSDIARSKVHGPVQTLRSEHATWDQEREAWKFDLHFTETTFRPDGAVLTTDAHNPDGSVAYSRFFYDDAGRVAEHESWMDDGPVNRTRYFYDEHGRPTRTVIFNQEGTETEREVWTFDARGRKSKVQRLPSHPAHTDGAACMAHVSYAIEGTDSSYVAPGATTLTIDFDDNDRPAKACFQDADNRMLCYVLFTRDSTGNVLREERHEGETSPLLKHLDNASPERRAQLAAMLKQVFTDALSTTTYTYDAQGRVTTREDRMGALGGTRITYSYNEHGDPVEKTTEHGSRQASLDEAGNVQYTTDHTYVQHNRLDYLYDAHGNWIERVVSYRLEPEPEFRRSNMERRTITYYAV